MRDDIETLIASGFDISVTEGSGVTTTYSYVDREWTTPELQILIDAVSSSQFLTTEKSKELIRRLVDLASPSDAELLKPSILVSGTFFSWIFQYAGKMTIVKPAKASNWYVNMLQEALDDALVDIEIN